MHGIPHFAISIALEREGRLVAGLIYNPVTDEMFFAERGQGAFHIIPACGSAGAIACQTRFLPAVPRMANAPDARIHHRNETLFAESCRHSPLWCGGTRSGLCGRRSR